MIQLKNIKKSFTVGDQLVHAIRELDLTITKGEFLAIMGTSGSGKSTLLNILGCLDTPSEGKYLIGGEDTTTLDDDQLSELRGSKIGFIFQSYNLLPQFTVIENIKLPLLYQTDVDKDESHEKAVKLAKLVGLGDRMGHRPYELSGGQQQRVAIARSLINDPLIILADEPTGNLDTQTEQEILSLFEELNNKGITIIVVTHEPEVGGRAQRVVTMRDGVIISETSKNKDE
ncbi:ABC transporter ATP-binding protein [Akkermansiaceae bacterium]|nr:ABC transporter ATP-binding protein [Akkermansiaceae bacterium]